MVICAGVSVMFCYRVGRQRELEKVPEGCSMCGRKIVKSVS